MTTINDVAARAGVGIGTVSRVINGHPSVAHTTRTRVQAAIAELDYHPSPVARALSKRHSNSIAVVVPFFTHPSTTERLRGVLAALEDSPYEIVIFSADHAGRRRARFARPTRRDLADGLLIVSLRPSRGETQRLHDGRIPTVLVDADTNGFPTVQIDDVSGGRMAADHLIGLGHRRIAFIGDIDPGFGFTSTALRRSGLAERLAASGYELDPCLVREGVHSREAARSMALELLEMSDRPTAVFAHSDTQAMGVLEAAAELGLIVPEDLSVIGFDDIELAGFIGLTTIRQPLFESGRIGASLLLELVRHGTTQTSERVELPLEIVVRKTTGPVPTVRSGPHGPLARRRSA